MQVTAAIYGAQCVRSRVQRASVKKNGDTASHRSHVTELAVCTVHHKFGLQRGAAAFRRQRAHDKIKSGFNGLELGPALAHVESGHFDSGRARAMY